MNRLVPGYMLAINYFLPAYLLLGGVLLFNASSPSAGVMILLAWLYLVLPLACRLWISLFGKPVGEVYEDSPVFAHWWFLSQLQMLYSRIPLLEELLRIVPGLYSLWLRIWGARASLLVFWSPGVHVFDRYHLHLGAGVMLGGGCRVGAHATVRDTDGRLRLIVAPLTIERGATVGMNAAVGPGVHVYANETVPAGRMLKPHSSWRDGRLSRPSTVPGQAGGDDDPSTAEKP